MKKPDWKLWLKDEKECKFWLDSYIRKRILKKVSDESRLHIKRTDHNLTFANWNYAAIWNNGGDTLFLRDSEGNLVLTRGY